MEERKVFEQTGQIQVLFGEAKQPRGLQISPDRCRTTSVQQDVCWVHIEGILRGCVWRFSRNLGSFLFEYLASK